MHDTGIPPREPELTVGPAEPLDDPAVVEDRLGFGRDPDRPGLLERLRGLPAVRALRARPVPRTVVAVVSALVSGVGVAVYLGGQPEETPAVRPLPIVRPESWLEVTDGALYHFVESTQSDPERQARAERELARHPADAPLVLALEFEPSLRGVPPGTYRLQATCAPPPEPARPVLVVAYHGTDEDLVLEMPCDGDFHAGDAPLHLSDYRAYTFAWYPTEWSEADHTIEGDPFADWSQVVVVMSLVPTD
ncbi:MAG: hypothetical protein FWJ70_10295 [Micromonosporaceae bacterium]|jgi:hypothetical protein